MSLVKLVAEGVASFAGGFLWGVSDVKNKVYNYNEVLKKLAANSNNPEFVESYKRDIKPRITYFDSPFQKYGPQTGIGLLSAFWQTASDVSPSGLPLEMAYSVAMAHLGDRVGTALWKIKNKDKIKYASSIEELFVHPDKISEFIDKEKKAEIDSLVSKIEMKVETEQDAQGSILDLAKRLEEESKDEKLFGSQVFLRNWIGPRIVMATERGLVKKKAREVYSLSDEMMISSGVLGDLSRPELVLYEKQGETIKVRRVRWDNLQISSRGSVEVYAGLQDFKIEDIGARKDDGDYGWMADRIISPDKKAFMIVKYAPGFPELLKRIGIATTFGPAFHRSCNKEEKPTPGDEIK